MPRTCEIKELERRGFSEKEILAIALEEPCLQEDYEYYYGVPFSVRKAELKLGLREKGLKQSYIVKKDKYSLSEAKARVKKMGGKIIKVDEKKHTWRFRQFNPEKCDPDSYATWVGPEKLGVSIVYCNLKR